MFLKSREKNTLKLGNFEAWRLGGRIVFHIRMHKKALFICADRCLGVVIKMIVFKATNTEGGE